MASIQTLWQNRPRLVTNPVILRELVSRLRSRSTFIGMSVLLVICAACAISWWAQVRSQTIEVNNTGRSITHILSTIGALFIVFWAPMMGAIAVSQERENGSWEMLLASPTNLISILTAKVLAPIMMILFFLFALLPFIALGMPFGGTSGIQILLLLITNIEMALQCILIGITCSAVCRHTVQAIAVSFLITFSWLILLPLFSQIWFRTDFLQVLSPFYISQEYMYPGSASNWMPNFLRPYAILIHYLATLLLFGYLFFFTLKRSTLKRKDRKSNRKFDIEKYLFPMWYIKQKRKEGQPFPDSINPIYVREMRERLQHNRSSLVISILAFAFLSFFLAFIIPNQQFGNGSFTMLTLFFVPFMILPGAIYALRQESDQGLWDMLLTTNISARQIVNAKAYINMAPFILRMGAFLFFWLLMAYFASNTHENSYKALPALPITVLFTALFLQQLGMYLSVLCKKTVTAFGVVFGLTILLYLGNFIIMQILFPISGIHNNHAIVEFCCVTSPLFLYLASSTNGYVLQNQLHISEWYNWMGLQAFWMGGASLIFYILTLTTLQRETSSSRL